MRSVGLNSLLVSLLLAVGSQPVHSTSPPLEQLKTHITSLQQVLCDRKLAGAEHLPQRRKLARVILEQLFDFREMSRQALGANARRYGDRLEELTPLFVDFLEHAYMGTLEENGDAEIEYMRERFDGQQVEIKTKTSLRSGERYSVDYKLYWSSAGWRVYDVAVEDISLVDNYRSQFNRILSRKSFDELLQDLRAKKDTFN